MCAEEYKKESYMTYNILYNEKKKDLHKMKGNQTSTYIHATQVKLEKHLIYQSQIIVGDRTSCFLFDRSEHRSGSISVFTFCSAIALLKRKEWTVLCKELVLHS